MTNEIASQYARPTQLIQLPIYEDGKLSSDTTININGRFEDDKNKYGGSNRKFVVSTYSFEVKSRMWKFDLKEII